METVKVKRDGLKGYHIINKASFDPDTMELYSGGKEQSHANGMPEETPKPAKRGRKPKNPEAE